jgi:hypothetical protein
MQAAVANSVQPVSSASDAFRRRMRAPPWF